MIIDEDLYKTLVKPLGKDVTLFAIFDCCHSGTALCMFSLRIELSILPALA